MNQSAPKTEFTDEFAALQASVPAPQNNADSPALSSAAAMSRELRLIASFHTFAVARITLCVSLCLFEIMRAAYGLMTSSALFILIFAALAPWLTDLALKPRVSLREKPVVFPYLRKKYRCNSLRHLSYRITFWLSSGLLLLWEFHNSRPNYPFAWLYHAPFILLAIQLLIRIFGPFVISFWLHRKLIHGEVN